jgi:predicted aspartyl protease
MLLHPNGSTAKKRTNNTLRTSDNLMWHRSISVTLHNGFLVIVEAQIGGFQQKQNFVVDTGTAPSILNVRLAKKLGLEVTGATLVAVGRAVETGQAVLPELELGPIHIASLPMNVMDLSRWERDLGIEVAGLLGMDVLGRTSFRLDYEKRELQFGSVGQEGIAVGYDRSRGLALAEATVQGKPVRLIVDTGSDLVVVYGESWGGMEFAREPSLAREGTTVAEQVATRQIANPEMELGGKQFRGLRTYYVPSARGSGYDGFFGVRALKLRGISFDRERQTLYLLN